MSDDHQCVLQSLLFPSDEEKQCIYRRGWVVPFPVDHLPWGHVPCGTASLPVLPNWSHLHEFTRGAKTQAGASCILQRHLKVAISKLKCVIQDYMSSQLREDVNCKEELGGQEAEAVVSLPLGDTCKLSRCWVSPSSAEINENWEGSALPI